MQRRYFIKMAAAGASLSLGLPVTAGASRTQLKTAQVQSVEGLGMEAINEQREKVGIGHESSNSGISVQTDEGGNFVATPSLDDPHKTLVSYTLVNSEQGKNREHFGFVTKLSDDHKEGAEESGGLELLSEEERTIDKREADDVFQEADEWLDEKEKSGPSVLSSFGDWGSDMEEVGGYDEDHHVKHDSWVGFGPSETVGIIHWENSVGVHEDTHQIMGIQSDVDVEAGANRGYDYGIDRAYLTHDWNEGGAVNAEIDRQSIYPRSNAHGEFQGSVGVEISSDGGASAYLEHSYSQAAVTTYNESQLYGEQLGIWNHEVSGPASRRRTYFQPVSLADLDDFSGCTSVLNTGLRVDWDGYFASSADDYTVEYYPLFDREC